MKFIIHMIANAHLDPVWLWKKDAGIDESLATCRTACDMLDRYPFLYITRGEAWVHAQIMEIDPFLFNRIYKHVSSGRWQIVNGWWIQPDCNLPTATSFQKQAEIGKRYFQENLAVNVTVGYNVDSFGHCATLPRFLRDAGMDSYIFMRPQQHEKKLPGNLFIWESPTGETVTAFRISGGYASQTIDELEKNVKASIDNTNNSLGHTMCFFGVGDHGGGPTADQIEWILKHQQYSNNIELKFSHPRAFFDAIANRNIDLPVIRDELQYHAVGCYSVVHKIKQQIRKAENLLIQAEHLVKKYPEKIKQNTQLTLNKAWKNVLFNQFHDIMAGTSIASAYEYSWDELGKAKTIARDIIINITKKTAMDIEPSLYQQLLITNTSNSEFNGYIEYEPWLGYLKEHPALTVTDIEENIIPIQILKSEAAKSNIIRLLIRINIPAESNIILRIHINRKEDPGHSSIPVNKKSIENNNLSVSLSETGIEALIEKKTGLSFLKQGGISISVFSDTTDTWTHAQSKTTSEDGHYGYGYSKESIGIFTANQLWTVTENGPLCTTMYNKLHMDLSTLIWEIFLNHDEPILRFRFRMHWQGQHKIVKLLIPTGFMANKRYDGIPGGEISRPLDCFEYPVFNYISLIGEKSALTVISSDIYASDVQQDGMIRLTLLRSPVYAHHDPFEIQEDHSYPITDQGIHSYEIALLPMTHLDKKAVNDEVYRQTHPIWISNSTRGMS